MNEFNPKNDAEILKRLKSGIGGTNVADSDINGNVLVNNEEIVVYDDTEIKERISPLEALKFRTMAGEELDYALLTVADDNNFLPKKDTIIPFNVVNTHRGVSIDTDNYKVVLNAGKTYSMQCFVRLGQEHGWQYFSFYDITHNTTIGYAGCADSSSWKASAQANAIYTPIEDSEICVKIFHAEENPSACTLQGSVSFWKIEEIGRTYLHDPVKSVNEKNGIEDTPVGHIMSHIGVAPKHYLACDGKEYAISDYPKLAEYFLKEFGFYNCFGGDGVTTFAVPLLERVCTRNSVIETMTSDTTPSPYVASSSSIYSSTYEAWKAFNKTNLNSDDCWATENGKPLNEWIMIDCGESILTNSVALTSRIYNDNSSPTSFVIMGSNDGSAFENIIEVRDSVNWNTNETRIFDFEKLVKYRYYKLVITANDGCSGYTTIAGFDLIKTITYSSFIKYEPTYYMEYHPKYGYMKEDVLFEGSAININTEYELIDSLENYDRIEIYIDADGYNIDNLIGGTISQSYSTEIIKERYSEKKSINGMTVITNTFSFSNFLRNPSIGDTWYSGLFVFVDSTHFKITEISSNDWKNIRISKIIGIKCTERTLGSSGSSEDESLTDEEINTLITNSFIKEGE